MSEQQWVELPEATRLINENSKPHVVSSDYVRLLGNRGYITTKPKDKRQKLYLRSTCARYVVSDRRGRKPRPGAQQEFEMDHTTGKWKEVERA